MGRRLVGTIRKLPSGRYQARYVDAAGRRRQALSTSPTKGEGTVIAAALDRLIEASTIDVISSSELDS